MKKLKWGIISTANIGITRVIPSMQKSELCEMHAIASRSKDAATEAASKLDIPVAYGSYEELLSDPDIDVVYNPLPNHLHVPVTIQALKAGKHVLCEKPIAITAKETETLIKTASEFPGLKVMEAFMYRFHPQWQTVKEIMASGEIGEVRHIHSAFSYFNVDPENVRNKPDIGGGGLLDVGCYCINASRMLYGTEPVHVKSYIDRDPEFKTDRLASGILEFGKGIATFTCSTQLSNDQTVEIHGTKGKLELSIPFNAGDDDPRMLTITSPERTETITFETCDQYTLMGDAFNRAIMDNTPVPLSLEESLANMTVIDRMFESSN